MRDPGHKEERASYGRGVWGASIVLRPGGGSESPCAGDSKRSSGIWIVDFIRIRRRIPEGPYDLEVPIRIELEYRMEAGKVDPSSLSWKVRYNRPLLLKEAKSRTAEELDGIVEGWVEEAVRNHLGWKV